MRILLDVDGVCADFVGHLLDQAAPRLAPADVTTWDVFGFMTDAEKSCAYQLLRMRSFWRYLPLINGAQAGVSALHQQGHDVVFVTSPWLSCTRWGSARRRWLHDQFSARPENVVVCQRKELVSGDVLVDDRLSNCESWQEEHPGGTAVLFQQPHNAGADWSRVCSDWPALLATLEAM